MRFPFARRRNLIDRPALAWTRFRALDTNRRRLLLEAAVLFAGVRAALLVVPFRTLRHVHGRVSRGAARTGDDPRSVGWAVQAVALRLSSRPSCLLQALVADFMLRRRGFESTILFGVRRPQRQGLDAHAWVECDGHVVVGALDELGDYHRLASGGHRG